jgi:hypothetical protein
MSCKNTSKKTTSSTGFDISSISGILNTLLAVFSMPEQPHQSLPPQLILVGAKMRPGLSADQMTADELAARQSAGIVTGDVFADGPNREDLAVKIKNDVNVDHYTTKAVVDITVPAGQQVNVVGVGNMGAPVVSQGATTNIIAAQGIIS